MENDRISQNWMPYHALYPTNFCEVVQGERRPLRSESPAVNRARIAWTLTLQTSQQSFSGDDTAGVRYIMGRFFSRQTSVPAVPAPNVFLTALSLSLSLYKSTDKITKYTCAHPDDADSRFVLHDRSTRS